MKYKDRRQQGPDQPVELLEFRPTLVPSILVNKLWADQGTAILWRRYPHLPALQKMIFNRRQWYANKVERLFVLGPTDDSGDLAYLEGLCWPDLKILELEVDWKRHAKAINAMLHPGLGQLEFLGSQTGDSRYVAGTVLPALFAPCTNLASITFGSDALCPEDPVSYRELIDLLDAVPSITNVRLMNASFSNKDMLFRLLSRRPGLKALHIDLDPDLQLLPYFSGPNALVSPFSSLRQLQLMCYPELAVTLLPHLPLVEQIQLDIARIPERPPQDWDMNILDHILAQLAQCSGLRSLRVNIGALALNFPSAASHPLLHGTALVELAKGCPKLENINLLASEPSAIDGSMISSLHFEAFCRKLPQLLSLNIKLHPQSAIDLEATALASLGKNCPLLETLRLKVSLHLPDLQILRNHSPPEAVETPLNDRSQTLDTLCTPAITLNGHERGASVELEDLTGTGTSDGPLFPFLTHVAFARPQSILSIVSDTYTVSSNSQCSSVVDPLVEEELVRSWAQPLGAHFPRLEILEAWSDWTGQDNESLSYFLPHEELLASVWDFLSGVEQDLWEDPEDAEEEEEVNNEPDWAEYRKERFSMDSYISGDWELASLVNEFPAEEDFNKSAYSDTYNEEPEGMVTPGRNIDDGQESYFGRANTKYITASGSSAVVVVPHAATH
ncbi:uncharacterized protein ALTATR162_LOCUS10907 [Alternaria atra]|uniref:Uncharacterized protein n=1 Tax=Alternaria atra TaxID=119953 RepID=A0A8J2ILX2_9PLEO|nr:uncharacterized protein ALTATR162_LOCUS7844 [Alternaria atra]XP_043174482.1 uncharacterized protein ALTATR162_LOCUS10907 [Alternaria atra]CAG5174708.1 unnamed protein product [Alternaria atra]CAG5184094.1 unnamed protein product [Alternaria atra]